MPPAPTYHRVLPGLGSDGSGDTVEDSVNDRGRLDVFEGDHYFGNQLLADRNVEIIASEAAAALMTQQAVDELAALKRADGKLGQFARAVLAPFVRSPLRASLRVDP